MIFKLIVLFSAVTWAIGAPPRNAILDYPPPSVIPILSQSEEYEQNGTYKFSYETGNGIKREETSYDKILPKAITQSSNSDEGEDSSDSDEIHVQRGSYSYIAPDGSLITVRYIADENGFRPIGVISSVSSKGRVATQSTFGVSEKSGRQLNPDSEEGSSAPAPARLPAEPSTVASPAPISAVESRIANNENLVIPTGSGQPQPPAEKEVTTSALISESKASIKPTQLSIPEALASESPTTISDLVTKSMSNTPLVTTSREALPTVPEVSLTAAETSVATESSTAAKSSIPDESSTTSEPQITPANTEPENLTTLNPKPEESTSPSQAVTTTLSVESTSTETSPVSEATESENLSKTTEAAEKGTITSGASSTVGHEELSTVGHEESSTESMSTVTSAEINSTETTTVTTNEVPSMTTTNENSSTTEIASTPSTSELTSTEPSSTSHTEESNSTTDLTTPSTPENTTADETISTATTEAENIEKITNTTSEKTTSNGIEVPTTEISKA